MMKNQIRMYHEGDILQFKKNHPCGADTWKVIRPGVDMKLECMGCKRVIIIPRIDTNKRLKKIIFENKQE